MMAARIFRGLESKQTRACAAHDRGPSKLHFEVNSYFRSLKAKNMSNFKQMIKNGLKN